LGEVRHGASKLQFDRHLRLEFRGAKVTTDAGLLRQSVYARLAGYEDVNDQELLLHDPAIGATVGKKAHERTAASSQTVARFETDILTQEDNLEALASLNHSWVSKAIKSAKTKKVIFDMDSSEFPVHGNQEGSACNGHFCSKCYRPLFVFNQFGDARAQHSGPETYTPQTAGGSSLSQ